MENLDHVERDERHHHTFLVGIAGDHIGDVDVAHVKVHAHKEARQHQHGDDQTLDHAVQTHIAGKDTVLGVARLALHNVALGVLHAQRERGETVGNQVHPQQLHRLEDGKADERGDKHREDLGKVGRKQELDDLADVVVDATALFAGTDDGGEVVVGKHHVGDVLGDIGTGDAHAHADVGALDGRGVVDAVARHGHDLVARLPSLDDAGLVLGLDAGVHAVVLDVRVELLFAHAIEVGTGDGLAAIGDDAQLLGNGHGGVDMVARNHDGADTGVVRLADGVGDLGADRVNHAGQATEDQVMLERGGAAVARDLGVGAACQRQHAQGLVGHGLVGGHELGATLLGQGDDLIAVVDMGAQADHHVGRALGVLLVLAVQGLDDHGHHLAARVKRGLAHARMLGSQASEARLAGIVDERTLGRLTHGLAQLLVPLGVGAQSHAGQELLLRRGELVLDDGHLVLGKGAGLVRADGLRAAKGLDGRKLADDRLALGHLGHAERKHDGHDGDQALGDGGDGERDGNHKGVEQGGRVGEDVAHAVADDIDAKDDDADDDHHDGKDAAELGELNLQRRELFLGLGQSAGDLAHLGVHTGADHDGAATAVHHGGAHVAHVLAVAERHVVGARGKLNHVGMLLYRHGLAGKGGFLDLHRGALEHAAVCRNGVARLEHDHIAGHELGARQVHELAVAQHLGLRRAHLLQGLEGLLALGFLDHAQHRVDDNDEHDDGDIGKVRLALDHARERADNRSRDQHDDHGVCHLLKEALPQRCLLGFLKLVRACLGKTRRRLAGAQAEVLIDTLVAEHLRRSGQVFLLHIESPPGIRATQQIDARS